MKILAPVLAAALAAGAAYAQSMVPNVTGGGQVIELDGPPPPPSRMDLVKAEAIARNRMIIQEKNIAKLSQQMLDLDQGIEERITRLVQEIKSVEDSQESQARVAQIKKDAMARLKKTIEFYARERDKRLQEETKAYSALPKDQLAKDVAGLGNRIEKRADQILELASSMVEQEGYQRYETYWDGDTARQQETEEYQHNQREASRTGQVKEDLTADLRKSIEKLERQNEQLTRALTSDKPAAEQAALQQEIQRNREVIERRRAQIQQTVTAAGSGRVLSSQAAFQMEQLVDDIYQDLRKDFNELVRLAYERDNCRVKLRNLQSQVKLIQQDLAAMPPTSAPAAP
jgi:hypothetical protein